MVLPYGLAQLLVVPLLVDLLRDSRQLTVGCLLVGQPVEMSGCVFILLIHALIIVANVPRVVLIQVFNLQTKLCSWEAQVQVASVPTFL